jgi:hypothetical protein
MINFIKIYGERNSGTIYLEKLLKLNTNHIKIHSGRHDGGTGWKHGFPKVRYVKPKQTLFIFIIRDVESWLKSMFKQPYHYYLRKNIYDFINKPLVIKENRLNHDVNRSIFERGRILDIRYRKIIAYQHFFRNIPHGIIISLKYLQENHIAFLELLRDEYKINVNKELKNITKHTKNNKNIKNRNHNVDLDINKVKINSKINGKIEKFVNNLNKECICK